MGHSRPIPKVRPLGLYFLYYPEGIFFCDRPSLTPYDNKFVVWFVYPLVVSFAM